MVWILIALEFCFRFAVHCRFYPLGDGWYVLGTLRQTIGPEARSARARWTHMSAARITRVPPQDSSSNLISNLDLNLFRFEFELGKENFT